MATTSIAASEQQLRLAVLTGTTEHLTVGAPSFHQLYRWHLGTNAHLHHHTNHTTASHTFFSTFSMSLLPRPASASSCPRSDSSLRGNCVQMTYAGPPARPCCSTNAYSAFTGSLLLNLRMHLWPLGSLKPSSSTPSPAAGSSPRL
jgi:hypothetical protein